MDALSPSDPCQEVILKFSAQSGKTEVLNNFVGFIIDHDPGPILVVQPNTKPMAEAWSKDRLAPMIRDTPSLKAKVAEAKGRDSANTIIHKNFPGGHLSIGGANSPAGLASRPIRYVLFDEIDRYQPTKEGNPIALGTKRTRTFWNRKILKASSPTFPDVGIDAEYQQSTQYQYQLQCQACREYQFPQFKYMQWPEGKPFEAEYVCEHCEHRHPISQQHKLKMTGKWVHIGGENPLKKGFWMNQWASPFATWLETINEFLAAKDDPMTLQTVVNTAFAETWDEPGEQLEPNDILLRAETYTAEVPEGVKVITAGVDVQDDRLECHVYGWNENEECWAIDIAYLYGSPTQPDVWRDLDDALQTSYQSASGPVSIYSACIDSGHLANMVYAFCQTRYVRKIYATKGQGGEGKAFIPAASQKRSGRDKRKCPLFNLGVDEAKQSLMYRLQLTEPGPGYIHIPLGNGLFGAEYAAQLTAEKRVTVKRRGFAFREWHQTRPRNEALDCWILALAALKISRPTFIERKREKRKMRSNAKQSPFGQPSATRGAGSWL